MSVQLGIWSDAAGGFIDTGFYSWFEAVNEMHCWLTKGEDAHDLTIHKVCEDHEEQQADHCEECFADDDEQECSRCADHVYTLSSDGLCDGCVEDDAMVSA